MTKVVDPKNSLRCKVFFAKAGLFLAISSTLAGCNPTPPDVQTRIIEIPSSRPYRFITYTDKTDEATAKQIRRHNRSHQEVINTEKAAKAKR